MKSGGHEIIPTPIEHTSDQIRHHRGRESIMLKRFHDLKLLFEFFPGDDSVTTGVKHEHGVVDLVISQVHVQRKQRILQLSASHLHQRTRRLETKFSSMA